MSPETSKWQEKENKVDVEWNIYKKPNVSNLLHQRLL